MNDLISRQAAIDAIDVLCQEHRYRIPGKRETYSQYNEAWQDALGRAENAIGNLPSARAELPIKKKCTICPHCDNCDVNDDGTISQPEQRWITSGKPMNSGMYLVTLRQKFEGEEAYGVRIMRFINGNWMLPKHFPEWINEEIEQEVLAWCELPEPWKEGEADG